MRPFKRILSVVDPTRDEQPALRRAAMLASQYQADLEIFASCYYAYLTDIADDYEDAAQSFGEATVRDVKQRLEQLAESIRVPGITISCRAEWNRSRHDSILEEAERVNADLIVKDTHYHTAISRALFTNTDWSLVRESKIPLWLVKQGGAMPEKPRILASVDLAEARHSGDSLDESLMLTGKELARVLHGTLYAYHAFDLLPMIGDAATWAIKPERLPIEQLRAELRASRAEALDALAGRHGIASQYRLLKSGSVTATLPGTATELGATLVVIGAVATNEARQRRIGSTAEAVLDHVPCDLLVLHPSDEA